MKRIGLAAFTAILVLFATASSAITIHVTAQNSDSIFEDADGNNGWSKRTEFLLGTVSSGDIRAGAMRFSDLNGTFADFFGFSIDPLASLNLPSTYNDGHTLAPATYATLQNLAANALDRVRNGKTAAAFQMAAWEIVSESSGTFDLGSGNFQITSNRNGSNKAESRAQTWLDNIADGSWTSSSDEEFHIISSTGSTALITSIAAVPLPASGSLLLMLIVGAGVISRRKNKA